MNAVMRNNEVLFIGSEQDCQKIYDILEDYHRYEAVRLELCIPSEQEYISKCLDKTTDFQYGY